MSNSTSVRIHPFVDGNGRIARLIANLPVFKSGFPPILIDRSKRRENLLNLSTYNIEVGQAKVNLSGYYLNKY
ncbi:MAG: Fic family protein [Methylococcaceae bacterium]